MKNVSLTIDGISVTSPPGTTILDAAEKVGIEIPRLCHQEGIKPSGNCRICVVEVEGSRTLVGSCHTPITQGMVVRTRSEKVLEARQATIFDKNLLFDGKSLWGKKDPVKEKNRAKGRETREASEEKGTMPVGTL